MTKGNSQLPLGYYELSLGLTNFRTTNDTSTSDWLVSFYRPHFAIGSGEVRSTFPAKWDGLERGATGNIRQFNFSINDGSISIHWGLPFEEMSYELLEYSIKICFYKKTQRLNQFPNYKAYAFIPLNQVFQAKELNKNNERKIKGSAHIFMLKEETGAITSTKTTPEDEEQARGICNLEYELTLGPGDVDSVDTADCFASFSKRSRDGSISELMDDVQSLKLGSEKKPSTNIDTLQQQNKDMKVLLNKALKEKDRLKNQIAMISKVVKTKPVRAQK